jgi:hypothetical protein
MKKLIFSAIITLLMGFPIFSQNCNLSMQDGDKSTMIIQTWTNPLIGNAKFLKAKDDEKDKQITVFNADAQSGKIAPSSNYTMIFNIKKAVVKGWDEYTLTTNIAGKDYSGYEFCHNDTMYLFRNRGPVLMGTDDNPIGYTIQGVQKLPVNMKVGDVLPSFDDISFIFPQTLDATVKHQVSDGFRITAVDKYGYFTDSRTGESGDGPYTEYTPVEVFKFIDVKVRQKLSFSGHNIHYMHAFVTAEEEVTISGVKHKAFIIESESWSKITMDASYESADKQVSTEKINKEHTALDKKVDGSIAKNAIKKGYTNKLGYSVTFSKEWFVPQMGIVKTEAYDMYGGISTIMKNSELE